MKGADEYYDLFKGVSQQIGRLYFQVTSHARGRCFEIILLPEGVVGSGDYVQRRDTVELYGMVSGQRGWTEAYGWRHTGKWVADVEKIMETKRLERKEAMENFTKGRTERKKAKLEKTNALLSDYE
ncbi:MAG: hypothetical protein ABUJ92_00070 [Desulfobacterales bacterium]